MVKTLDLHPVSAEEGFVVFEGSTGQALVARKKSHTSP